MLHNLPTIITCGILGFILSKAFIIIIQKLPNFLYQEWAKSSQNTLNLKNTTVSENLNTNLTHKKIFYAATIIAFITAAVIAKSPLQLFAYLTFISIILILIVIDYKTMLLPDELTLPLIWLGLLFNLHGTISGSLEYSVYGAVFGYLILWSVFWAFKLLTKKDGMGYGDFKLLSAILAFIGIQYLVPMLLLSSMLGIVYVAIMSLYNKLHPNKIKFKDGGAIPFGPYLSLSGLILLFWGNSIINFLVHYQV